MVPAMARAEWIIVASAKCGDTHSTSQRANRARKDPDHRLASQKHARTGPSRRCLLDLAWQALARSAGFIAIATVRPSGPSPFLLPGPGQSLSNHVAWCTAWWAWSVHPVVGLEKSVVQPGPPRQRPRARREAALLRLTSEERSRRRSATRQRLSRHSTEDPISLDPFSKHFRTTCFTTG